MVEIGELTNVEMTYDEAVIYCFVLGEGWRLPTYDEYMHNIEYNEREDIEATWYENDPESNNMSCHVIPVRDIENV